MPKGRPTIFIGSSVEGIKVARAVQLGLEFDAEVTLWSQGPFGLGQGTLESLVQTLDRFDFAVLVLTADDLVESRGKTVATPRDNVLFELGLFMGGIGRNRTFVVHDRTANLKMPSDLAGVTTATYEPRASGDLQAALGAVCARIAQAIETLGKRTPANDTTQSRPTPRTLGVPPCLMVTGGRDAQARKAIDAAYEFGRLVAERDFRLLSGVAEGVDESFCRGVVETASQTGKDPKRILTCYTGKGRDPVHRFGRILESRFRAREEGIPELLAECDIAVLFGGGKNTHYLGVLTLLEGRILLPVACTGGAAADLYALVQSRFDQVFAGRLEKQTFADLADLNSSPLDVARACMRIVEALSKTRQ